MDTSHAGFVSRTSPVSEVERNMLDFIFASQNISFAIAIGLMLAIGLLEGIGSLLGMGFSSMIDSVLPEADIDIDMDVDVGGGGFDGDTAGYDVVDAHVPTVGGILSKVLGWLHIGRVPVLVLFVMFLFAYGASGYITQSVVLTLTNMLLPGILAVLVALVCGTMFVRIGGGLLAKVIPRDETDAVESSTFVGRMATITLGTARRGSPAEAKLHDQHGQSHYVMVEPDVDSEEFTAGDEVLVIRQGNAVFYVIANTSPAMTG